MKKLLTLLLLLMVGVATVQAAAFEKEAKFRTTKIHMSSDKPLAIGSNTLVLKIIQKGEVPQGAKVSVKAFMPAMPGMPAMESKADAKALGNGAYEATVNLAMGGTWQLHIFITPTTGKRSRVKTSLNL